MAFCPFFTGDKSLLHRGSGAGNGSIHVLDILYLFITPLLAILT